MVNFYKEEIAENWDICPNCSEVGFNINLRRCTLCDYDVSHNTLFVAWKTKEKVEENIMTPEEIAEERKYTIESRWKERRVY